MTPTKTTPTITPTTITPTIKEYRLIADKMIGKLIKDNKIYSGMNQDIDLKDEVVSAIMSADWKFDGRGSLYGYRKYHVRWAIKRYFHDKHTKPVPMSNCDPFVMDGRNGHKMSTMSPKEIYEFIDELMEECLLTSRQRDFIDLKYYQGLTYEQIGKKYNLSKQRVEQCVKQSLKDIREMGYYIGEGL